VEPGSARTVQTTILRRYRHPFTVGGQIILVDDLTVFANLPASPSAAVGALVAGRASLKCMGFEMRMEAFTRAALNS